MALVIKPDHLSQTSLQLILEGMLGLFPIDAENWEEGVDLVSYARDMQTYRADMQRRLKEIRLKSGERLRLSQLRRAVKIAVLSEDWCIDCLMTLPIMARITAAAPSMELRVFSRGHWPSLKEYYNQQRVMAIPVYSFLDEHFAEFARFIERPQSTHEKLTAWKAAHPEIDEIRRSFTLSNEEKKARLARIRVDMQLEMEGWYAAECQSSMVSEVAALLGL